MLATIVFFLAIIFLIVFSIQGSTLTNLKKTIEKLEKRIKELEGNRNSGDKPFDEKASDSFSKKTVQTDPDVSSKVQAAEQVTEPVKSIPVTNSFNKTMEKKSVQKGPGAFDQFVSKSGKILFGGNLIMKVGGLVLFIGISFFIKYMAPYFFLPIELRLALAALFGLLILNLGWDLRDRKRDAALILQGVGFGIIYLTLFASSTLFQLMSPFLSMLFMNTIIFLAVVMAILQKAPALAFLGILGGFLAPVLIKSEDPNILVLFIYYTSLNLGVLAIRWFKKWESLELIAFLFTFVITALWQWNNYQAHHYWITQIFLIVSFFIFISMQLMHLKHQAPAPGKLAGYLVYALPLVICSIQLDIVKDVHYASSFSTLAIGAIYILIAARLWKVKQLAANWIINHFLIVGTIIITTGIAFAFEGRANNLIWLLEGAALVIMGVKEKKLLPRVAGYVLQGYAGIELLLTLHSRYDLTPFFSQQFISSLIVAVTGLITAYFLSKSKEVLKKAEAWLVIPVLFIWAFLWWYGTGIVEITRFGLRDAPTHAWVILFFAVTELGFAMAAKRLKWKAIATPAVIMPFVQLIFLLMTAILFRARFDVWGLFLIAWLMILVVNYKVLHIMEQQWKEKTSKFMHLMNYWVGIAILAGLFHWTVGYALGFKGYWASVMIGLIPALIAFVQLKKEESLNIWPVKEHKDLYNKVGLVPVMIFMALWLVIGLFIRPNSWPVHYLPFLNNMELVHTFLIIVIFNWLWLCRVQGRRLPGRFGWYGFALLAIGFITSIIGRSVHVFEHIRYKLHVLSDSMVFQSWLSVIWTAIALTIMVVATKKKHREAWFGGALFLGIVILKLFFVDLSKTEALMRVVSFVGVGLLTLLLGYLSPLPPLKKETNKDEG